MNKTHALGGIAAVSLALLLGGCGSSSTSGSATPKSGSSSSSTPSPTSSPTSSPSASPSSSSGASSTAAAPLITIKNFKFSITGTVAPGATVMVKNDDSEAHTVTADGKGGFDVKVDPGTTVSFKAPAAAGSYPFHCNYHAEMHGTLTVT